MGRLLTKKLRLKVNESKSAVARPEERKFVGFSISKTGVNGGLCPRLLIDSKCGSENSPAEHVESASRS